MTKQNNKFLSVIAILTIIFSITAGTLAYWGWASSDEQKTNVVFTVAKNFSCAADGGGDITSSDVNLAPSTCMDPNRAIQRTIVVTPTIDKEDLSINMDLWLDINSIGAGLTNSKNFKYALTTSSTSCTDGVVSMGDFYEKNSNEKVNLLNKSYIDSETDTYYLYIWLDKVEESDSTMNQKFDFGLGGSCTDYDGKPEAPVLDSGMIPVTISDDGTVRTVSSDDSSWYNYDEKKWANVVLVNENATENVEGSKSRQEYLTNLSNNIEVNESDILAYYVWIPRYKYKIPYKKCSEIPVADRNMEDYPECYAPYTMPDNDKNLLITYYSLETMGMEEFNDEARVIIENALNNGRITLYYDNSSSLVSWVNIYNSNKSISSGNMSEKIILIPSEFNDNNMIKGVGNEVSIDIAFEDGEADISYGNALNTYYTHPAFWWDDNNDGKVNLGETIPGVWVGKFETSPDPTTKCYDDWFDLYCNNSTQSPRILPNEVSLTRQDINNQFLTSQNFSKIGNIYGLSNLKTDSHMMKNSEWGAVAYLSHSKYGINKQIYINNSASYITGRSSGGLLDECSYNDYGYYTWLGQPVSLDGNIEISVSDSTRGTNASTTGNITGIYDMSGGAWEYVMGNYNNTSSYFSPFPDKKYYDVYMADTFLYTEFSNIALCTLETCGGHALYETIDWYISNSDQEVNTFFVDSYWRWFKRGGDFYDTTYTGLFKALGMDGSGDTDFTSWRSVLVVDK